MEERERKKREEIERKISEEAMKNQMEKEKDHDTFPDAVAAHTDGKCGGAEDQDKDKTGERVVDGEVEGAGEESCSCKTEKVNTD
jgi:hypothetical protein